MKQKLLTDTNIKFFDYEVNQEENNYEYLK